MGRLRSSRFRQNGCGKRAAASLLRRESDRTNLLDGAHKNITRHVAPILSVAVALSSPG
jgi:hypothetical protein